MTLEETRTRPIHRVGAQVNGRASSGLCVGLEPSWTFWART